MDCDLRHKPAPACSKRLAETPRDSLEAARGLLQHPMNQPRRPAALARVGALQFFFVIVICSQQFRTLREHGFRKSLTSAFLRRHENRSGSGRLSKKLMQIHIPAEPRTPFIRECRSGSSGHGNTLLSLLFVAEVLAGKLPLDAGAKENPKILFLLHKPDAVGVSMSRIHPCCPNLTGHYRSARRIHEHSDEEEANARAETHWTTSGIAASRKVATAAAKANGRSLMIRSLETTPAHNTS